MRPARALEALNFFLADVQAGIGPFVGVILLSRGWGADAIGTVMTLAGLAAMAATPLAGALVDAVRAKRALIVVAAAATALASLALMFVHSYPAVAATQILAAVSGAALAPAVAGVTLGIVRRQGFDRQFGRNQVANHAGNVAGAALAGWLGWHAGFDAVFALVGAFTVLAIVSALAIPGQAIDHACARGLDHDGAAPGTEAAPPDAFDTASASAVATSHVGGLRTLAGNRPLVLLGASLALFHLGNAAMLPLYGMGVVVTHRSNASAFTAQTIVIAQFVMIAAAWLAPRLIRAHGYWRVLLFSYLVLPVRGAVAAAWMSEAGVWPVQVLDGIGAGLQSVVVPALVVRLLHGSGRVNAGQGAVATAQGIGAALSPVLGGMLAQHFGYPAAFVVLGAVSTGSLALWLGHARALSSVCGKPADLSATSS
ncbi:TPA: MFS transporter [Burkholderia aenigmatica]|uniref:MFS transporter n=1 Tax=Burkholderia sp. AU45251 TaxID=3059204 RepID=UPI00264EC33C|nr:MFS transporter [Burkholderia sp. AU45251]HDR9483191.1 MFS transporter [Burkholderia aenigmatica]MDN7516056.1 MFS transporter [Burkholderia sp. AU45251]HDR9514139.1 MFS transporter [Burkholderia aenigmatica]HDR9591529.1 MFS transporter [Burkholderia aenigmatica]HDR9598621.1 MFS transporter [Burkholderia aenigmatica]